MSIFEPIAGIKERFNTLTSLLWINKYYQAAFTVSRTPNRDVLEYYWYTKDHQTCVKTERLFYVYPDNIVVDFEDRLYKIIELGIHRGSVTIQAILQMESIEDRPDYRNYVGSTFKRK